ncbi:MAG: NAD(P)-binding domain-containing protein [Candidatus Helarchaeota archaeon]
MKPEQTLEFGKIVLPGGTGAIGAGLSMRLTLANIIRDDVKIDKIIIGSRSEEKARRKTEEYNKILLEHLSREKSEKKFLNDAKTERALAEKLIEGTTNREAVKDADIIILTLPYKTISKMIPEIKSCINAKSLLIDCTVPLINDGGIFLTRADNGYGSASEHIAALIPNVPVIGAFKTLAAHSLQNLRKPIYRTVFIFGNDPEARRRTVQLAHLIEGISVIELKDPSGTRDLIFARQIECMVATLINANKSCGETCLGINVTGWSVME